MVHFGVQHNKAKTMGKAKYTFSTVLQRKKVAKRVKALKTLAINTASLYDAATNDESLQMQRRCVQRLDQLIRIRKLSTKFLTSATLQQLHELFLPINNIEVTKIRYENKQFYIDLAVLDPIPEIFNKITLMLDEPDALDDLDTLS